MEHTSHDSLTVARRMGEAGMEQAQADAIAWAIRDSFKEAAAGLATKDDLAALDGKIDKVETRLDGKIDKVGTRLDGKIVELDGKFEKLEAKVDKLDAKIDTVKSELKSEISEFRSEFKDDLTDLRAEISWMPLRVCWWMLLTLATAAGLLLTAQQLWTSGLPQSLLG